MISRVYVAAVSLVLSLAASAVLAAAPAADGLVLHEVNPWDLPPVDRSLSDEEETLERLRIDALRGAYCTRAIAITNTGDGPVRVQARTRSLVSLKMDREAPPGNHIQLAEVAKVGVQDGWTKRDALPPLGPAQHLVIPSGHNAVLWVTVDTTDLPAGLWTSVIRLLPMTGADRTKRVRIALRVLPQSMPDGPKPYSYNWYGLNRPPTRAYPEAAVEDLKRHYTNIVGVQIGWPEFNEDGEVTEPVDFSGVERAFDRFGKEGNHFLLKHFYRWFPDALGNGSDWNEQQQKRFEHTIRRVRDFFENHGLTVEDFSWYVEDEPTTDEEAKTVAAFGKRMDKADPEQRIFCTVYDKVTVKQLRTMLPYVNLWCPKYNLAEQKQELIESRRKKGARYFSYSVLPRTADPYNHYRLQMWKALKHNYEGVGFWNYNDVGGPNKSNWDHTDSNETSYSVVYRGRTGPVSSVRWEAWRQGIQDYRLHQWVSELAREHSGLDVAEQARKYVESSVERVLGSDDRGMADRVARKLRRLGLRILVEAGTLDVSLDADSISIPKNLTGNGGVLTAEIDTDGTYTYSPYPDPEHHGEASGVSDGPVFFDGSDAKSEPQSANERDGDLTDDNVKYSSGFAIWFWPDDVITTTFDLKDQYRLSHALVNYQKFHSDQRITVLVSSDGTEGSWTAVDRMAGDSPRKGWRGELSFDLEDRTARYVRFRIRSAGEAVRLGEVRLWGWPSESPGSDRR